MTNVERIQITTSKMRSNSNNNKQKALTKGGTYSKVSHISPYIGKINKRRKQVL